MTEHTTNQRILVGVDGSEPSIEALRYAARLAAALGTPIDVLTTWEYPALVEYYPIADWSPEEDAKIIIADAVKRAFHDAPPAGLTTRVVNGHAARTLIEQSAHYEMLVVGSRGHGGFAGLLLGSVSTACAEHARCPVLIVHTDRAKAAAERQDREEQAVTA